MVEIKIKRKSDKTIIVHKRGKGEQFSSLELDIINKNEIEELEKIEVKNTIAGMKFKFEVRNCNSLDTYLQSNIKLNEFFNIVLKIINVVKACYARGIRVSNLESRLECIFHNPTNGKIKMLYWPILSMENHTNEKDIFQKVGICYLWLQEDDTYRTEYDNLFENRKEFDINDFEKKIMDMKKRWDIEKNKPITEPDGEEIKFGELEATRHLLYPTLMHVSSNQRREIIKSVFVIGRLDTCDYVINDPYVGREHAMILQEGGKSYIVDRNSKNGVFVNNEKIVPGEKVLLNSGSIIAIRGEKFVYFAAAGKFN